MSFKTAKNDLGELVYFKILTRKPKLGDWVLPIDTRSVDENGNKKPIRGNRSSIYKNITPNSFYKVYKVFNVKHILIIDDIGQKVQLDSSQYQLVVEVTKDEFQRFTEQLHVLKHLDSNMKKVYGMVKRSENYIEDNSGD
ncbi:hypothetical protein [Bacillus atrophaeus]|uniref:hypothetical protein n=1 Tax=Bacillus atrophaeus TaxID=1452 RepID=UPI002E1BD205|nr:hypothetical protein [Bacillus atrophaeus]